MPTHANGTSKSQQSLKFPWDASFSIHPKIIADITIRYVCVSLLHRLQFGVLNWGVWLWSQCRMDQEHCFNGISILRSLFFTKFPPFVWLCLSLTHHHVQVTHSSLLIPSFCIYSLTLSFHFILGLPCPLTPTVSLLCTSRCRVHRDFDMWYMQRLWLFLHLGRNRESSSYGFK